ncbi:hypothetical protein ACFOWM_03090 [Ferruginibacter yonginensis]|uniref:MetA-pathway of phenol degradation n=1 Tax=Ferruginibacter yonginensis TaxID=1310416 RepID=A0ABV8QPZ9_9BACT
MKSMKIALAIAVLSVPALVKAQSPVNGFMQGKGKGNVVVSYSSESYDKVFLVPTKVDGVPVFNKVTTTSVNVYGTYGISNKVDLQLSVPYIKSKGEASEQVLANLGYTNEMKGLQDISLYAKYNPYNFKIGKGNNIALLGSIGFQAPIGDYKVDQGLQSIIAIGNRATQLNTFIAAHFKGKNGTFLTGTLGYSIRGNDVPSAFISELKAGYANKHFYVDVFAASQLSSKGVDIVNEGFKGAFPLTKVNYNRIGINAYVPVVKGFGITGGFSAYVDGRNLGEASGGYGGVVYSF